MANNSSDSEQLKLQIKLEIDEGSKQKAQQEINDLQKGVTKTGGTGKAGSQVTADSKQRQKAFNDEIALIRRLKDEEDVRLRKMRIASRERIDIIRREGAANKTSIAETNRLIQLQENEITDATNKAVIQYDLLDQQLQGLKTTYVDVNNALQRIATTERGVMVARDRATTYFDTMSRSMMRVENSTKATNLAFMDFSRIVQDAPFGLIGIANNIDPLLNSFSNLRAEAGSTGGAFLRLGKQLTGPAGLIFLLGSALPSALIFLQSRQRETTEETDLLAQAIENVRKEFAKLVAEAAAEKGRSILVNEIIRQKNALDGIDKDIAKITGDIQKEAARRRDELIKAGVPGEAAMSAYNNEIRVARENNVKLKELTDDRLRIDKLYSESIKKNAEMTENEVNESILRRYNLGEEYRNKEIEDDEKATDSEIKNIRKVEKEDLRAYKSRKEFLLAFYGFTDQQNKARLLNELDTLSDLLNSEFITGNERIEIIKRFNDLVNQLHRELLNEQIDREIEAEKKKYDEKRYYLNKYLKEGLALIKAADDKRAAQREYVLQGYEANEMTRQAIRLRGNMALAALDKDAAEKGLKNDVTYLFARAAIEKSIKRDITNFDLEQLKLILDATFAIGEAIFGDTQALRVSEVVVDTIMGVQRALATNIENPVKAAASSALLIANGAIAIRKILSTKKGDSNLEGGGKRGFYINDVYLDSLADGRGMTDFSNSKFINQNIQPMPRDIRQPINIQASVDRRGLAIAVREGERNLQTQQISYI